MKQTLCVLVFAEVCVNKYPSPPFDTLSRFRCGWEQVYGPGNYTLVRAFLKMSKPMYFYSKINGKLSLCFRNKCMMSFDVWRDVSVLKIIHQPVSDVLSCLIVDVTSAEHGKLRCQIDDHLSMEKDLVVRCKRAQS